MHTKVWGEIDRNIHLPHKRLSRKVGDIVEKLAILFNLAGRVSEHGTNEA
jgi:hypothetical protein